MPNTTAYNETCAAIGDVFWNQRMFLLHGESKYIDVMEKVLYNGLISGVGLDGKTFFYTNAMQVTNGVTHHELEPERSGWFECSCCPTNMARFLPSLSGYMYAQKDNNVFVNLFIAGTANMEIGNKKVSIVQSNNYPWNGALSFAVIPEVPTNFAIHIRIPGWARAEAIPSDLYAFQNKSAAKISLKLNGKAVAYKVENGYAVINRQWKKGDNIGLNLPMEVKKVIANKALVDDKGKTALQRGPIIYCAEWKDNGGTVSNLAIPANAAFKPVTEPNLLNGVTVLKGEILSKTKGEAAKKVELTAIPYYSWANRGKGEMTVWFPEVNAATK